MVMIVKTSIFEKTRNFGAKENSPSNAKDKQLVERKVVSTAANACQPSTFGLSRLSLKARVKAGMTTLQ